VVWQSVGKTLFGYAAWGWLRAWRLAARITPMVLLVPVFGIGAAVPLLEEALQPWKLAAAAFVLGGVALNTFWPAWPIRRFRATT
jgi:O-acetylserine/cysteine efflux transporter